MRASLIQLKQETAIARVPIEGDSLLIGRDPSANLVIVGPGVSRRHAAIEVTPSGHVLVDLGSANGTLLNGRPVTRRIPLRSGDRIELADEAIFLYEAEEGDEEVEEEALGRRTRIGVLIAAGVLVTGLVSAGVWWLRRPDPLWADATLLAQEGLEAYSAGDPVRAKARLQSAAGLLYSSGVLDDVPRREVMKVAFQRLGDRVGGVDLVTIFRKSIEEARPKIPADALPREPCQLDHVEARKLNDCITEQVRSVMIGLRQSPEGIPPGFYRDVGRILRSEHDFIARSIERGRPELPMIKSELQQAHLPPLLHYLALIESGYQNSATSTAAAAGMWQFIPETARRYGLEVGPTVDQRRDPVRSTHAAAQYLNDLAFDFGGDALLLALAGYNRGEAGVRAALKRMRDPFSDRTYWRLVENNLLPAETADYVPRFFAAAVAGEGGLPNAEVLTDAGY